MFHSTKEYHNQTMIPVNLHKRSCFCVNVLHFASDDDLRLMIQRISLVVVEQYPHWSLQPLWKFCGCPLTLIWKPVMEWLNMRQLSIFTIAVCHMLKFHRVRCPLRSALTILSVVEIKGQCLLYHFYNIIVFSACTQFYIRLQKLKQNLTPSDSRMTHS